MSARRKEYFNPEEAPLWVTAHKRRPEFSRDYLAYWFTRYGFVILVCFFIALVLSAITVLPQLRHGNSLVAIPDSLQSNNLVSASENTAVVDSSEDLGPTLLLNVASEPSGQTVFIDFDSVGVTPLYRQKLTPGVYVVSAGFSFQTRRDTVLVASNTDSHWVLFAEDRTVAYQESGDETDASRDFSSSPFDTPRTESAENPSIAAETPEPRATTSQPPARSENQSPTVTPRTTTTNESDGGTLVFRSDPPGALVLLDDVLVGTTPLTLVGVPSGQHDISVKRDGYDDYRASVRVADSESFVVEATLASRMGQLVVLVEPWGSIYIDGKLYKLETDIEYTTEIPAGRHIVTATHPSLGSISREIEISGGERQRITLSFNEQ